MDKIFNKIRDVDPNNSDAVKDILSTFFQNILKHADTGSFRWLRTLENVVNRFPKYCGSHRNTIETYLVNFIDSTNYFNVIEAAKCAHVLQQVRPPQEKTATAKISWRDHLIVLCNVAHELIAELFPNTVDMYKGGENRQKPQLQSTATSPLYTTFTQSNSSKTSNNNINKQYLLSTKLKNVLIFLQAMLVEVYPVAKPVQPQIILEVIVRALSVSSGAKTNLDISTIAAIKIQALKTLDALVACLGPNLIPFSALVFRVVTQTLRWSSDNPNEESGSVRACAYNSGAHALQRLRARPADAAAEDELSAHLAADIAPARRQITLTMNSQPTKNLSKKAKRKLANTMLQDSSIAAHTPGEKNKVALSEEVNDDVAIPALHFAETLLTVCGIYLKPATHKLLQELLVRECFAWERHSLERLVALLRVLEALRKTNPSTVPPPTQYCLQLYSVLINSGHREYWAERKSAVKKLCAQYATSLRQTGGGSGERYLLSELDKRLVAVMGGTSFASGDSELAVNPFPETHSAAETPSISQNEVQIVVDIPFIDISPPPPTPTAGTSREETVATAPPQIAEFCSHALLDIRLHLHCGPPSLSFALEVQQKQKAPEKRKKVSEKNRAALASLLGADRIPVEDSADQVIIDISDEPACKKVRTVDSDAEVDRISLSSDSMDSVVIQNYIELSAIVENGNKDISNGFKENESRNEDDIEMTNESNEAVQGSESEKIALSANYEVSVEVNEITEISSAIDENDGVVITQSLSRNIHDARTQMPLDTVDGDRSPISLEVAYDYPNTGNDKITVLEKVEDENLPSTNDTDDIHITCGQVVKSSQDNEVEKNKQGGAIDSTEIKVNGNRSPEKTIEEALVGSAIDKTTSVQNVNVNDMLADFVDEVIE